MILRILTLVVFALGIAEKSPDEREKIEFDEMVEAVEKQLKALELRMTNQQEQLTELKVNLNYLQTAEPRLGALDLIKDDDGFKEIISKTHAHQFTHVAAVSLRVSQRDLNNLPKNKLSDFKTTVRRSSVQIIITVNSNQKIQLWDAELNELAEINPGLSSKVTAVKAMSANERAYLLVGGADGNARVFSVSAWRVLNKETHIWEVAGYMTELVSSRLPALKSEEIQDNTDDWPSAIQDIGWSKQNKAKEFLVGYSNGWIRQYQKSGKIKKEVYTGNSSVLAIGYKTDRTSKPVFTTNGYRFCKISNLKMIGGFCAHKEGTQYTGHAFDLVKDFFMYVGYSDGTLILFDTKSLAWKRLCKPQFEIEVEAGSPLSLEVTEGYLLASSPTTLYIFNTTRVSTTKPPVLIEQRVIAEDRTGVFGALTSTQDAYHHTLVVATHLQSPGTCDETSKDGSIMVIYEAFKREVKKTKTSYKPEWLKLSTPMFILGGLVIAWKFTPLSKIFGGGGKPERHRKDQRRDYMNMQREILRSRG